MRLFLFKYNFECCGWISSTFLYVLVGDRKKAVKESKYRVLFTLGIFFAVISKIEGRDETHIHEKPEKQKIRRTSVKIMQSKNMLNVQKNKLRLYLLLVFVISKRIGRRKSALKAFDLKIHKFINFFFLVVIE